MLGECDRLASDADDQRVPLRITGSSRRLPARGGGCGRTETIILNRYGRSPRSAQSRSAARHGCREGKPCWRSSTGHRAPTRYSPRCSGRLPLSALGQALHLPLSLFRHVAWLMVPPRKRRAERGASPSAAWTHESTAARAVQRAVRGDLRRTTLPTTMNTPSIRSTPGHAEPQKPRAVRQPPPLPAS